MYFLINLANFCNPYFLPPEGRKLTYDKHLNVVKKENLVDSNYVPQFYKL